MIQVYYAEDDEIIAKSVKEYLEQQNCRVTVFRTIADIKKALISHLPVIYLTVRGDSCDIVRGFQNGADDYVVKPFDLSVLHSRILALLRRAKSTEAMKFLAVAPIVPIVIYSVAILGFVALAYYAGGKKS